MAGPAPAGLAGVRARGLTGGLGAADAELRYGVERSARAEENGQRQERFLLPLEVVAFDAQAGRHHGRVRAQLGREGYPMGANDLLIAVHALSLGVTLVTNDVREFERVAGLQVERWD